MRWEHHVARVGMREIPKGFREITGFLFSGYRCSSPGRNTDLSRPSIEEVKNKWSFTITPTICLCDGDKESFIFSHGVLELIVFCIIIIILILKSIYLRFWPFLVSFLKFIFGSSICATWNFSKFWKVFCVMCKCWIKLVLCFKILRDIGSVFMFQRL